MTGGEAELTMRSPVRRAPRPVRTATISTLRTPIICRRGCRLPAHGACTCIFLLRRSGLRVGRGPSARYGHAMAETASRMMLFGGGNTDETWWWMGPPGRSDLARGRAPASTTPWRTTRSRCSCAVRRHERRTRDLGVRLRLDAALHERAERSLPARNGLRSGPA